MKRKYNINDLKFHCDIVARVGENFIYILKYFIFRIEKRTKIIKRRNNQMQDAILIFYTLTNHSSSTNDTKKFGVIEMCCFLCAIIHVV